MVHARYSARYARRPLTVPLSSTKWPTVLAWRRPPC